MTEKTKIIIKKVAELYSFGTEKKTAEEVTQVNYEKLLDKQQEWEQAFDKYDTDDVIQAINNYWRYKSDKTRPSVAQILAILQTEKEVKPKTETNNKSVRYSCAESELMSRDIALKRNSEFLLNDYRRAVDYILNNLLVNLIGEQELRKLSSKDKTKERSDKYKIAMDNGLFNQFDDVLRFVKYGESDVCDNFTNI